MIDLNLGSYVKAAKEYTELRVHHNHLLSIALLNGDVIENSRATNGGVSCRVYNRGAWGFASHPTTRAETIRETIEAATDNAQFLSSRLNKPPKSLPSTPATSNLDVGTKKSRWTQNTLIEFLKELDAYLAKTYSELVARKVGLFALETRKQVATSDGSEFFSLVPRSAFLISLSLQYRGETFDIIDLPECLGHYEDHYEAPWQLHEGINTLYEHLRHKAEGVYPQAGGADVVLHPDAVGILAHEAIGHTTEADGVLGGSIAKDYLNREVASPLVTLIDFAHQAYGQPVPVPVEVDDEGTSAVDTLIIETGVLKNYMHNKESASLYGVTPTGHARASQFSDEPLIRMRNTAILPGTAKLDDLIGSIDHGYYLMRAGMGQADSSSEFMFSLEFGYEIEHGKIGRGLKSATISGNAFEVLKTVSLVSDNFQWTNQHGMCGKKQLIPVSWGGPALKCRVTIGGK